MAVAATNRSPLWGKSKRVRQILLILLGAAT